MPRFCVLSSSQLLETEAAKRNPVGLTSGGFCGLLEWPYFGVSGGFQKFLCLSIKRPVALRLVPIQTSTLCALNAGAIGEPRVQTRRLARSTPLIGAVVDFLNVISTKFPLQNP